MKLLLKVKNGTPPQRKAALRQLTDKARELGAGPLFNQILPLLVRGGGGKLWGGSETELVGREDSSTVQLHCSAISLARFCLRLAEPSCFRNSLTVCCLPLSIAGSMEKLTGWNVS